MIEISDSTIQTLKKMYNINQSLKFNGNNTQLRSINESRTMAAYAEINEEFERDFCVYDLGELISIFSIIQDPMIDLSNPKYAIIQSGDGNQKLKYYDTEPELITSYFEKQFELENEDIEVDILQADMKAVMKAANTLSLEYIGFKGDGEKVYMRAFNSRKGDSKETNSFTVVVGETEEEFDLFYKSKMVSAIDADCTFTFAKSSKAKLSRVVCGHMTYWIALDKDSTIKVD